ncbi:MAG: hypothetical protein HY892_17580 [Deltaproteobacteria bacterium]|nr:hypothetical protein [Deltaproteobacteria bacterium]
MKVVEKDKLVEGMLQEELERCRVMISSLEQGMAHLPKGSLHVRKKQYKKKRYRYFYLKYREEGKSVSHHVPAPQLDALKIELDKRRNIGKEIKAYQDRVKYLEKILGLKA